MPPARLLIVDDNESVRKALRRLLTAEDFDVCGDAVDGPEAIQTVRRLEPDLVIMDLLMPGMSGLDAAREMRKEFPAALIMLMTAPDADIVEAARRVGIRGTVSKGDGRFVSGVHAVLRGEEFYQLGNE
jgi:two-component system chemotaxis response regulator CheY